MGNTASPFAFRAGPARLIAMLAVSALLLVPSLSSAAPITTPTGLLPGAQYRLAFVTAGTHDATSSDLADYDAFVTAEANAVPQLNSLATHVAGGVVASVDGLRRAESMRWERRRATQCGGPIPLTSSLSAQSTDVRFSPK